MSQELISNFICTVKGGVKLGQGRPTGVKPGRGQQVLIMGDFNFPTINWAESYCAGSDSSAASAFIDSVQDSFLVQHVASSTRHRQRQQPSLLDLMFTLDPNSIDEVTHLSPLGSSDHVCLLW